MSSRRITPRFATCFLTLFLGLGSLLHAQLTGTKTIPGDYASFASAVADLNVQGVGVGGVTFNVAPGYTEANVAAVLTVSTNPPNASRPIVFRKASAGANPLFTAATGISATVDGIVILNGIDWVTFDGIDLQENAANVTNITQMEWGYALVKIAASNGAQNNTIKNCTVTLNKANAASVGIYLGNHIATSTTSLTVNNFLGTSSYNKFYNNTLQNCYQGITISGYASTAPFDFYDNGNEVGVDGISTRRNQVINYGGAATTASGIAATNQNNLKVFNTFINNSGGATQTGTLSGISTAGGTASNVDIYNDTLTLTSAGTTGNLIGINAGSGNAGAGNAINVYNCVVTGCTYPTATTAEFRGISTITAPSYINIYNNTVSNNSLAGTGTLSGIFNSTGSATVLLNVDVHDNTITNNTRSGAGGNMRLLNLDISAAAVNCYNNIVSNNSNSLSAGTTQGYYNIAGLGFVENVYNNQIFNLTGGTGETEAIYASSGPITPTATKRVSGNLIHDITANTTTVCGAIFCDYGLISNIYQNNIYNIVNNTTTGGTPAVYGIRVGTASAGTTVIYNNFISELKAPNAANTAAIRGLSLEGSASAIINAYHNTIYLNASSVGANFGTTPVFCGTSPVSFDMRDNIFVDLSLPTGTGRAVALSRSTTTTTNYGLQSGHNCLYAGTPGLNNLIYTDGTNFDQTVQAMKNRVGPREQASFSEIPPFISLVSPYDLHLQSGLATQCESGGQPIGSVTTDFDGAARNTSFPDVGADELTGSFTDIASPDIQYTLLTNSNVAATRVLPAFATVTDPSNINVNIGTKPRLYYKKSINANTYVDNTNVTDGWKYVEASNATSPFNFTIDYSLIFTGAGVVAGDNIQYFVVAQDLNGTPRIGLNNGGFTLQPTSVALAPVNFPLTNTINSYNIVGNTYSGVIPVGPTETITSLTNAGGIFALINAGVLSGNVTINITGDLTAETGTNPLNQWAEVGGSNYTVSIVPSAATTRVISGSHATLSLVRFDGADRVTIDGRFSGSGNFLTFRNTSNSAPAIGYINDAQNHTLRNSIIESGNTATSTTAGGAVFIGTTTGSFGNDNITVTNNEIRDRSDVLGTSSFLINCAGTTTTPTHFNSGVVISNNNFHDWFLLNGTNQNAIQVATGNTGFAITGNSFYQTATRSHTLSGTITRAINITNALASPSQGGHDVSGNFIGGSAPGATGADWVLNSTSSQQMICISVNTGLQPSTIQNNIVRKISFTTNSPAAAASMFIGIQAAQGNINVTGNTIGAATGTGAITININPGGAVSNFLAGIFAISTNGTHNVNGNTVGGWTLGGTMATGAYVPQYIQYQGTPTQPFSVSNNLVGSTTTANSILNTNTTPPSISFGIRVLLTTGVTTTVSGNTVQNITDLSGATGSAISCILFTSSVGVTSPVIATNNTVKDIAASPSPAAPTISVVGMALQGYGGRNHNISGNAISNISNPNAATGLAYTMGIQVQGSSAGGTMARNKIFDIRNAQTGIGAGLAGIYMSAGDGWNISNNMVSITNGVATNSLLLFGIADYCNGLLNMNYNSVYVGGANTGASNSYSYARGANSRLSFHNNLLYNERTGGTGFHYAIGNGSAVPADGWNSTTSSYNTFIAGSSARIGEWGTGTGQTFAQWKTSSGGDIESYADTTLLVPSASLFTSAAAGDLSIRTAGQVSWYVNGKGIAGTISGNIATDHNGNTRSTTLGTPTDIGAFEFTPNVGVNPIPATASAAPALSTTTAYTFAGRRLGEITWGATGTVPSAINWTYFSGVPPIGAPGSNINSYWDVAATGGTGYSYAVRSFYTVHEQNALADGLLNLGKKDGSSAWFYLAGTAAANSAGKYYDRTGLNSLSQFTLGTSAPSPDFIITATVISGSGTITPSGAVAVTPLNNQSFAITPDPCFAIDSVFVDGGYVGAVPSFDFAYVAANHTIGVKFRFTGVVPSVTISASPGTTICAGTNVTFTAVPTNGGTTPAYQWKKNGGNVGTNSPTYSDAGLLNGDVITVVLTSNAICVSPTTATSNALTISVVTNTTPGITITANPSGTVCPGTSVTFTAVGTTVGTTPSYQWKLNGGNVGTNSTTYTNASLVSGDVITCVVTSSDPCALPTTATSNAITMTVGDFVNPTAVCQAVTVTLNGGGTGSTTAAAVNNGSSDNCTASPTLSLSTTNFTCANLGANTVVLTVTDGAGRTGTCNATVTVVDNIAPAITCPANATANNDPGLCTAAVTYSTPAGTDNCTPTTTQTSGLASAANFPLGTTTNTFRVTDGSGNSTTCSFTVTVTDNEAPTITCPANIGVNNDAGLCSAVVSYSAPNGADNCTGATTTQTAGLASNAVFPVGVTTNTFTVTDGGGTTATCSFDVTVTDAEAPVYAACVGNMTVSTSPTSCDTVVTWTAPTASDNCSVATSTGSSTPGSVFALGTNTVTYTATDVNGNTGTCSFDITVVDNTDPTANCQAVTVTLDVNGNGSTTASAVNNGSTDLCGAVTLSLSQTAFTCADAGSNTVVLTVTDGNGNTSTCSTTVTVLTQAVSSSAIAAVDHCGFNVSCNGAFDGSATATGSGGCGPYTYLWSNGQTIATATGLGAGVATVTVTDAAGGTSVATVTLTQPSVVSAAVTSTSNSCPNDATGSANITPAGGNSCSPYTYLWSNAATTEDLTGVAAGTYTVTVTDINGCTGTQSVTVGSFPAPSPTFTVSGNTLTSVQTWTTYQWQLNGTDISGATASTYVATASGSYTLVVTDANGCTGTSPAINVTVVATMDPAHTLIGLSIYPNPARGAFNLLTEQPITQSLTVSIFDMYGHRLTEKAMPSLGREVAFDIQTFAAGTYMVEVQAKNGQRKLFRLVVQ